MACLLNRAATKAYVLGRCKVLRPAWGCKRVSGEALTFIEGQLRAKIDALVWSHPSNGVTFRP